MPDSPLLMIKTLFSVYFLVCMEVGRLIYTILKF